jgi:integrase
MTAQTKRLNARSVATITRPGRHADGGNLYLSVNKTGARSWARSWLFIYKFTGRKREMGLGSTRTLTLAEAREKATDCRKLLLRHIDPLADRRDKKAATKLDAAKTMTFRQCAEAYIAAHKVSWSNPKHAAQWPATLNAYAYPIFGELSVQSIDVGLVTKALEAIWQTKTETASRLRGRIEAVLDWATVRGFRQGDNPARWRGHLENLLPARTKLSRGHHAALPLTKLPEFMAKLRSVETVSARALEFAILTAARTGEVLGAKWSEIDLDGGVWTVPAARMKGGREHRVPLSAPAKAILEQMHGIGQTGYVFPNAKRKGQLPAMALYMEMRRLSVDATPHGFRSTFRDWAAEHTSFPHEVCEAALAHAINSKVEAAYRRGDLLERRRELMAAWASACDGRSNVVPIGTAA